MYTKWLRRSPYDDPYNIILHRTSIVFYGTKAQNHILFRFAIIAMLCPTIDNAASNTSRLKKTSNLFYEFLLLIQLDWRDANKEKADWKPDSK